MRGTGWSARCTTLVRAGAGRSEEVEMIVPREGDGGGGAEEAAGNGIYVHIPVDVTGHQQGDDNRGCNGHWI